MKKITFIAVLMLFLANPGVFAQQSQSGSLPITIFIVQQGSTTNIFSQETQNQNQSQVYYQPMTIQIGSYLNQQTALSLTRSLLSMGFPAYMERTVIGNYYYWRVILFNVLPNEIATYRSQLESIGFRDLWVRPSTPSPSLWR